MDDAEQYARQRAVMSAAPELVMGGISSGKPAQVAEKIFEIVGPIPAKARAAGASLFGYTVKHPNTGEVTNFAGMQADEARKFAELLGTKVKTLYSMPVGP